MTLSCVARTCGCACCTQVQQATSHWATEPLQINHLLQRSQTANWLSFDDITKCSHFLFLYSFKMHFCLFFFFVFFINVLSSKKLLSHNLCCLGIDLIQFSMIYFDRAWTIVVLPWDTNRSITVAKVIVVVLYDTETEP